MQGNAKNKFVTLGLILWIIAFCLPYTLLAQDDRDHLEKRISYQCMEKPMAEILIDLSRLAESSLAFDGNEIPNISLNLDFEHLTLPEIFQKYLEPKGLRYEVNQSGLVVTYQSPQYILRGYVQDAESGERLVAATVYDRLAKSGVVTNAYGFFSLKLPAGQRDLEVSYLGYERHTYQLELLTSQKVVFSLRPSQMTLVPVEISDALIDEQHWQQVLSEGGRISTQAIVGNPALGGEVDVLRYLMTQEGIGSGADGLGGLHVRGGGTDQNLILLDDVPIFQPSHALGLFSIFNPVTLHSAKLQRSGFSARYGGHLSAVLDLRSKEGNVNHFESTVDISTVATKVSLEVPLNEKRGGCMLAARRSHLDPLIQSLSRNRYTSMEAFGQTNYHFFDLNAKLHQKIGDRDKIYLSFYKGEDRYLDWVDQTLEEDFNGQYFYSSFLSNQSFDWGNLIGSARWNHIFGDRLFSNLTLTYSNFKYKSYNDYSQQIDDAGVTSNEEYFTWFFTDIRDFRLKLDFDYYWNENHKLAWGASALHRIFEPGSISENFLFSEEPISQEIIDQFFDDTLLVELFDARSFSFYLEDQWQLSDQTSLRYGLRHTLYQGPGIIQHAPQPRFALIHELPHQWQLRLSGSRMMQHLHLLTAAEAGLPTDLWVPATDRIKPQSAWELTFATSKGIGKNGLVRLATYYKSMQGVLAYAQDASLPGLQEHDPRLWEEQVRRGRGEAYGLEVALHWRTVRADCNLNYTWSRSRRRFDDLNNGQDFPFRYDRPHALKINIQQQIWTRWQLQLHWQYNSGQPITLLSTPARFSPLSNFGQEITTLGNDINAHRMPAYHRLDLNMNYNFQSKNHQHRFSFGVYNAYKANNPIYQYILEENPIEEEQLLDEPGLGIIPTIGYRWKWSKRD